MIFAILQSLLITVIGLLALKDIYCLFCMLQIRLQTDKAYYYYRPIFGLAWKMVFFKDTPDEWKLFKDLVKRAEVNNKILVVSNAAFTLAPLLTPVGPELIKDYFDKELEISDRTDFQQFELVKLGILYKYTPKHLAMRGVFTPIFGYDNLLKMSNQTQMIVERRLLSIGINKDQVKTVDIKKFMGPIFMDILDQILFGCQDFTGENSLATEAVQLLSDIIFNEVSPMNSFSFGLTNKFGLTAESRRLKAWNADICDRIGKLYKKMESEKLIDHSFLGQMVKYNLENPEKAISLEDIIGNTILFVFAAYDTTRHATTWAFHFLGKNLSMQNELREFISKCKDFNEIDSEPHFDSFIKEVLRLGNPFMFSQFRRFKMDVTIQGIEFKKGWEMLLPTGLSSWSNEFNNPYKFDEKRFLAKKKSWSRMSYIPFSYGKRNCIGQEMARMNMKIILSKAIMMYKMEDAGVIPHVGGFPFNSLENCTLKMARLGR